MSNIFSPSEAKQARALAKLSQGKVASDIGINRTYLSLFESGKYVFDDSTLVDLRDYYEELGSDSVHSRADFGEGLGQGHSGFAASKDVMVENGIEIPPSADEVSTEEHINIRNANRQKIHEICSKKVRRGLLGGIDRAILNSDLDKAVQLLAENELMTAQMDGYGFCEFSADVDGGEANYVGNYLADRLLNPKKISEDDWWGW